MSDSLIPGLLRYDVDAAPSRNRRRVGAWAPVFLIGWVLLDSRFLEQFGDELRATAVLNETMFDQQSKLATTEMTLLPRLFVFSALVGVLVAQGVWGRSLRPLLLGAVAVLLLMLVAEGYDRAVRQDWFGFFYNDRQRSRRYWQLPGTAEQGLLSEWISRNVPLLLAAATLIWVAGTALLTIFDDPEAAENRRAAGRAADTKPAGHVWAGRRIAAGAAAYCLLIAAATWGTEPVTVSVPFLRPSNPPSDAWESVGEYLPSVSAGVAAVLGIAFALRAMKGHASRALLLGAAVLFALMLCVDGVLDVRSIYRTDWSRPGFDPSRISGGWGRYLSLCGTGLAVKCWTGAWVVLLAFYVARRAEKPEKP